MTLLAIIFDMDGTLSDTIPVVTQAFREMFLHYSGREYSDAEITAMFGPAEEGVIRQRVAEHDFEAALRMYLDRYEALHQEARLPFPGVIDLLERLQAGGIRTGVVTGKGPGTAEITMRVMGIAPYIDSLEAGSAGGAVKPAAIRKMLAEWGIPAEQAAYVGDMPYDMRAAREAGVIPLGAAWAPSATVRAGDGAEVIFDTVEELKQWVEERI